MPERWLKTPQPRICSPIRWTRIRRACLPPFPNCMETTSSFRVFPGVSRICFSRRPGAASTTAARSGWTSAAGRSRRWWTPAADSALPATIIPDPGRRRIMSDAPLLQVRGLTKHFDIRSGRFGKAVLKAVDGIDLTLDRGESLGLVGESGSGKSTVARLVTGLHRPTGGEILFEGSPIQAMGSHDRRRLGRDIQMVFQDPHSSLNPRKTIFGS